MPLIRLIPERHRDLVKELLTFGTVGAINTGLGQLLFNVFFGLGWLTSSVISTGIATVCSFILNRHITYRHRQRTSLRRELPLFIGLNLIGRGIQVGILDGLRRIFDIADADRLEFNIARFGGVIVGTIFLLLTYRTFVFKAKKPEANAIEVLAVEVLAVDVLGVEVPAQATGKHRSISDATEFAELTESLEAEFDAADQAPARPAPAIAEQQAITGAL